MGRVCRAGSRLELGLGLGSGSESELGLGSGRVCDCSLRTTCVESWLNVSYAWCARELGRHLPSLTTLFSSLLFFLSCYLIYFTVD